jgi:hypothetical protein|tara:strand:+ start:3001 stop:3405 length:405 start_codon:yes stop_codon:yes gene_type:complete
MKNKSIPKLKKELDKWFSLYIRLRHADENGRTECWTCGKIDHYKKLQAGHFQSRRHLPTRWNEINVQVQCVRCNMFNQGEQYAFGKLLDIRIGEGISDELVLMSKSTVKYMRHEYVEKIDYYKEKVKILKKSCE